MDIFLHIGMSKAGSSAIQMCMLENRDILKKRGIEYPVEGIPGTPGKDGLGHHDVAMKIKKGRPRKLRKILERCECNTIVLSCEAFWQLGDKRNKVVETLRSEFRNHDATVIFYLRNPRAYLLSSYRQNVKDKGETCSPEDFFNPKRPNSKLIYSRELERWGKCFPLRVRAYEAVKHGIEADFMRAIGAPVDQVDTSRRVVNTTPSDGTVRLMLLANRYLPSWASGYARRLLQWTDPKLGFTSPIDDEILGLYAEEIVKRWDKKVIKKYMKDEDWKKMLRKVNTLKYTPQN